MTALALSLLLISAMLHATWNLLAKRTSGGAAFAWLYDLLSTLIYAPIMLIMAIIYHLAVTSTVLLFGAWMGTRLLAEGNERRTLIAAAVIVLGIAALAIP